MREIDRVIGRSRVYWDETELARNRSISLLTLLNALNCWIQAWSVWNGLFHLFRTLL